MDELLPVVVSAILGMVGGVLVTVLKDKLTRRRMSDKEMFMKWRVAFDRRAFKGPYDWHSDPRLFEKAIRATIKAVTTGVVVTGAGSGGEGKAYIRNPEWRSRMDDVERRLSKISNLVTGLEEPQSETIAVAIDRERDKIIKTLNEIWTTLGIPTLPIPTEARDVHHQEE